MGNGKMSMQMEDRQRPITLITGASSGIGAEIAKLAVDSGHEVLLVARRKALLDGLRAIQPSRIEVVPGDLRQARFREKIASIVGARGRLDYLVNNAGTTRLVKLANQSLESLEEMVSLNLVAVMDLTRRLLPNLEAAPRGRILNVSSGFGCFYFPFMAVYVATKHGVNAFTKSLNLELLDSRVTATAYCPGNTATDLGFKVMDEEIARWFFDRADDPALVARNIWNKRSTRKVVVYPSRIARATALLRFLPDTVYRWLLAQIVKRIPQAQLDRMTEPAQLDDPALVPRP